MRNESRRALYTITAQLHDVGVKRSNSSDQSGVELTNGDNGGLHGCGCATKSIICLPTMMNVSWAGETISSHTDFLELQLYLSRTRVD